MVVHTVPKPLIRQTCECYQLVGSHPQFIGKLFSSSTCSAFLDRDLLAKRSTIKQLLQYVDDLHGEKLTTKAVTHKSLVLNAPKPLRR